MSPAPTEGWGGVPQLLLVIVTRPAGAGQGAGTTMLTLEPLEKSLPFVAVKVKLRVTAVWVVTLAGPTVIVPSPSLAFPSVNVVCARIPEVPPVAVTTNRTLTSCSSGEKSLLVQFPP